MKLNNVFPKCLDIGVLCTCAMYRTRAACIPRVFVENSVTIQDNTAVGVVGSRYHVTSL